MTLAMLQAFHPNFTFPLCLTNLMGKLLGSFNFSNSQGYFELVSSKGSCDWLEYTSVRSIYFPFPSWTLTLGIIGCGALQCPHGVCAKWRV